MRTVSVIALLMLALGMRWSDSPKESSSDELARTFLESLSPDLRKEAQFKFDDDYRTTWNYVPIGRRGASLDRMTEAQIAKGTLLLKASLSDVGYKTVEQIRSLEDVLFELENRNPGRDKTKYYFTFFGEPSAKGHWAWRYEGHHLSLSFAYLDGKLIASSPQFLGTNPAEVKTGPHKGRVLAQEEDLAFDLLNSLAPAQLSKAIISKVDPGEIVTSNKRKAGIADKLGIPYADLNQSQRKALMSLVRVYAGIQTASEAKRRLGRVEPESLVFAWMGATKTGEPHYYRIQGSKFLIEFDNSQNNANHIHSVWRDFDGDFGEDVLADHYHSSPHHHHSTKRR